MSEQELNSYRFISGEDPSDEMLSQIMAETAREAAERKKIVMEEGIARMKKNMAEKLSIYENRIKEVRTNG